MSLFGTKSSNDPRGADSILRSLENPDTVACCEAAQQAGDLRLKAAVLPLVKLLYSTNKRVIAAAAHALGEIGDLSAIQHLGEASYAQEFAGGIPGFITHTATGDVVEVAEEDILRDKALREAVDKLWRQPSAQQYLAKLGNIKMYTFGDFLKSDEILIERTIQDRIHHPFTDECARRFFNNFAKERFAFEGEVKTIAISSVEEALRPNSVDGVLLSQTLDEMGKIHFKFGGNAVVPYLTVEPEPDWPRPSIVRRCVLDGRTDIRFDELS